MASDPTTTGRFALPSCVTRWTGPHGRSLDNLFSLIFIQSIIAGVGFLTRVNVANALGKETFGDLAFAVAIGTYGLMFIQYGLEKSLLRELVHFPDRFGELLKASLALRLGLFAILLLLFVVAGPFYLRASEDSCGMALVLIATVVAAFQLQAVYDGWKEMRRHAVYLLIERCTYFALVWFVILVPFLTLSLVQVGLFMVVAVSVGLFLQYRWAMPRIDFKPVHGLRAATDYIMRSNIWIWLAVLSGLSIEYLNQIILKCYAGSSELGGYSAAWLIARLAILMLTQVGRIGFEATARHTRPDKTPGERLRFLVKYVALMAVLGFLTGLPCILCSERILTVFQPEYATAAGTLRILGLYPLLYGPYLAVLQYVISSRLQRTYFTVITVVSFLSIGICFWLIPGMQSAGAAMSVVISLGLGLVLFLAAVTLQLRNLSKSARQNTPS